MTIKNKQQEEHELEVTEALTRAFEIGKKMFGQDVSAAVVFDLYDDFEDEDEDEVMENLGKAREMAKAAFDTETPTPEQVLGTYDRAFLPVDED